MTRNIKMIKRFGIILFALFILYAVKAYGNTGFNFLKMEFSPKYISTAGTIDLFSGEGNNINYNPANLSRTEKTSFDLSYRRYIEDGNIGQIAFSKKLQGKGAFGFTVSYFYMDGFEGYIKPMDEAQFDFSASSLILGFGYCYEFLDDLSIGISTKYLAEKIDTDDADGYSLSLGGKYDNIFGFKNTNFSAVVKNYGSMNKMLNEESKLPFSTSIGIGHFFIINDYKVLLGLNDEYFIDDEINILNFGTELSFKDRFFVRAGYRYGNEGIPYSLGLGFNISRYNIDYSFSPFTDGIGYNHGLSLKIKI